MKAAFNIPGACPCNVGFIGIDARPFPSTFPEKILISSVEKLLVGSSKTYLSNPLNAVTCCENLA